MIPAEKGPYMDRLWARYRGLADKKINVDMKRGNPCSEQLDLSDRMFNIKAKYAEAKDGTIIDCRNYSGVDLLFGLPAARVFAARYLGTKYEETAVIGNSSLMLMHNVIGLGLRKGLAGWKAPGMKPKFICPVPGYDRHFGVCEDLDVEMTPVPLLKDGPDMAIVRELVKDPSYVGIWCVPLYWNPTGAILSEAVAKELATMKTACPGFVVMWDNAYAVHGLTSVVRKAPDIMRYAREAGTSDRIFIFGSLSKVTHPGGALAFIASSPKNLEWFGRSLEKRTIGSEKLNQLRHIRFLRNMPTLRRHMARHATILRPKLAVVENVLSSRLGNSPIAKWSKIEGGYFVSVMLAENCAEHAQKLCKDAGVILTDYDSAYPYRKNPMRNHNRIPFTFQPEDTLKHGTEVYAVSAELSYRYKHPW